jgi:hypothetical protein
MTLKLIGIINHTVTFRQILLIKERLIMIDLKFQQEHKKDLEYYEIQNW